MAYESLNIAISSSMNIIRSYETEIKAVDKAIANNLKGLMTNEYTCLISLSGVGPVFSAGILSEIGSMQHSLAQYAGITWNTKQSGNFNSENTKMSRNGNPYLRYYIMEATNSARKKEPSLFLQYSKKYEESKTHKHKRALALTSRKFIRMIYGMLNHNQLYSNKGIDTLN